MVKRSAGTVRAAWVAISVLCQFMLIDKAASSKSRVALPPLSRQADSSPQAVEQFQVAPRGSRKH